jgi:hypothetical protein
MRRYQKRTNSSQTVTSMLASRSAWVRERVDEKRRSANARSRHKQEGMALRDHAEQTLIALNSKRFGSTPEKLLTAVKEKIVKLRRPTA